MSHPHPPSTLSGQFRRQLPYYLVGLVLLAAYQGAQYLFNVQLSQAIDAATNGMKQEALRGGALLVGLALFALVVRIFSRVVMFNAGRRAEYELRNNLLKKLQTLDSAFYNQMSPGEIMSRATNDLTQVRLLLGFAILNLINTIFGLVGALAFTLSISVKLTVAALAPLPLLFFVTSRFATRMFSKQKANQEALGELSDFVQSSMSGTRVIRAFNLEAAESEKFGEKNRNYLQKSLALARLRGSMGPVMQGITSIGILIVFWYGGILLVDGEITQGHFVSFFRALGQLTWPLMAVGFLVGMFQRGRAGYSRLKQVFDAQPKIKDGPLPAPQSVKGHLLVRDLHFSYGDEAVLKGIDFELPAGGSVAFVGRTGSGKTTLARLLPRLLDCPSNSVFLDGTDICQLPLSSLRHTIGYAAQNPFLFSTTAGENIGISLDDAYSQESRLTIREAARRAHILDELLGLPDGLETVVGEKGVQLSGGQKQRVALASAFVLAPQILVLDDPLSAVDARTEAGILEAIDEQMQERGVVLITHRVAAAARCDLIYVLDEGRIIESGSHQELEKLGGVYASFVKEQKIESELSRLGELDLPTDEMAHSSRASRQQGSVQ